MAEFAAVCDSITVMLDSLKISTELNNVNFGVTKNMVDSTVFPSCYKKFTPSTADASFSCSGFADFTDVTGNNLFLYDRLSTQGHILSIGTDGATVGKTAYFYKCSLASFSPMKADNPEGLFGLDMSANVYARPVIRGQILEDGRTVYSAPTAPVAALKDPAAPGNIENGTHSYKVTYVYASGEGLPSAKSNVITIADKTVNGQVTVTIPVGPEGVTQRKLYRTVTGDAGNWKLLTTVANNVATTYLDNTADAGLGADAPAAWTFTSTIVDSGLLVVPPGKKLYCVQHVLGGSGGTLTTTVQSDTLITFLSPSTVTTFTGATGLTQEMKNSSSNLDIFYRISTTITGGSGWQIFVAYGYAV